MKFWVFFVSFLLVTTVFGQQPENNVSLKQVEIYQNTSSDILFVKHGEIIDSYKIIDMNGKVVQQGQNGTQVITILDLNEGFYLLEVTAGNQVRSFKIRKH